MKIAIVLGTRPELIKLAPVIQAFRRRGLSPEVFLTGQHKELLEGVLEIFEVAPVTWLKLDHRQPDLASFTGELLKCLDNEVFAKTQWDAVMVHGDTTTAMTAALGAFYRHLPVAHVEAGLRTFDMQRPFPEELNRQIISRFARWHFCPTPRAQANLIREGVAPGQVIMTGNTVVDALNFVLAKKLPADYATNILPQESPELAQALERYTQKNGESLSLMTLHRRENQHGGLVDLFNQLKTWLVAHPRHHMLYPYHLSPKIKDLAHQHLSGIANLHLIPPLSYRPMIFAMKQCHFALSDSSGLQEELPTLQKPLVILRDVTERPEVLEKGLAKVVGLDPEKVLTEMDNLSRSVTSGRWPSWYHAQKANPFGDGYSSDRIVEQLIHDIGGTKPPPHLLAS